MRKGAAIGLVVVGVAASIATGPPVDGFGPGFIGEGEGEGDFFIQDSDSTAGAFLIPPEGITITARATYTSTALQSGNLVVDLFLDLENFERATFQVIHGSDPATAETLTPFDGELQVRGTVAFDCAPDESPCVHEEPIVIRITRTDDGVGDVDAAVSVTASMDIGPNGTDIIDVALDQPAPAEGT